MDTYCRGREVGQTTEGKTEGYLPSEQGNIVKHRYKETQSDIERVAQLLQIGYPKGILWEVRHQHTHASQSFNMASLEKAENKRKGITQKRAGSV